MAIFRNIHTSFWEDSKVQEDMGKDEKYFFLYLLTNPHTSQIGCYEITIRQMQYETGLSENEIEQYLERFEKEFKIIEYSKTTKELLIKNWYKYNFTKSPKMFAYIKKEMQNIKNIPYKNYLDTVCIPYVYGNAIRIRKEQEKEKEKEEVEGSGSRADGSHQSDGCVDEVVKFYEQNFGTISPFIFETLNSYRGNFTDDIIIYAMQLTLESGAKTINYVKAILNNWQKANVKTLFDAKKENEVKRLEVKKDEKIKNAYRMENEQYQDLSKFYAN